MGLLKAIFGKNKKEGMIDPRSASLFNGDEERQDAEKKKGSINELDSSCVMRETQQESFALRQKIDEKNECINLLKKHIGECEHALNTKVKENKQLMMELSNLQRKLLEIIVVCSLKTNYKKRKVVIFGAGSEGRKVRDWLLGNNIDVDNYFDNDKGKTGKKIDGIKIKLPEYKKKNFVIVASDWHIDISEQLIKLGYGECDCCVIRDRELMYMIECEKNGVAIDLRYFHEHMN